LADAYLPGRLEALRRNPMVVIDAAHNPDGAQRLVESVQNTFKYRRLILVIGMLSTHSAEDVLNYLAPRADEVIATKSQWEKARPAQDIFDAACQLNPNVRIVEPVSAAVQAALESAAEDDLILITGSFYTIGEVDREAVQSWTPANKGI
jgi:dihydrofolate synthase/folylpolyglutamate synthase